MPINVGARVLSGPADRVSYEAEITAHFHPPQPIPADPLGQRLHEIFGRNLWDFIEAPAPVPGEKAEWRTVKRYPLRPRVLWQRWQDPDTLIGVRFASQTLYGVIDIDAGSPYCNPEAVAQLRAALETIGITSILLLRSSYSNGLHLYLPLPELVKTFDLAVALQECLRAQDFEIANGTLEIFPNPKPYGVDKIIHYNGHRLPLQPGTGACLLDKDLNPIDDTLDGFLGLWEGAAGHQAMDELRHALKIGRDNYRQKSRRRETSSSSPVDSWRQDLETEIEAGWSGPGQTNHLLKTVACHGHVFLGLAGDELISHTLATAIHLPGYQQHCRHQPDIERRVTAWCKAVEKYYWPLGDAPKRDTRSTHPPTPSVNEQRAASARDRIASAIAQLKELGNVPDKIRDLAQHIAQAAHCSLQTVYKYLTLWHPDHTEPPGALPAASLETPPKRCVTVQPEPVSAPPDAVDLPSAVQLPPLPETLKPLPEGLLHTSERSMKCRADLAPLPKTNSPAGGVRGGSPQVVPAEKAIQAARVARAAQGGAGGQNHHCGPLPPLSRSATAEERECYDNQVALRQCLFELQWDTLQVVQYIAEQFEGKWFYQLTSEEVVMLIYRLRLLEEEREE